MPLQDWMPISFCDSKTQEQLLQFSSLRKECQSMCFESTSNPNCLRIGEKATDIRVVLHLEEYIYVCMKYFHCNSLKILFLFIQI